MKLLNIVLTIHILSSFVLHANSSYEIGSCVISVKETIDTSLIKSYQLLSTNKNSLSSILQKSQANIVVSIPFMDDTLVIYLEKSDLYDRNFYTVTSSGDTLYRRENKSLTYQGKVSGFVKSMAAFIFEKDYALRSLEDV